MRKIVLFFIISLNLQYSLSKILTESNKINTKNNSCGTDENSVYPTLKVNQNSIIVFNKEKINVDDNTYEGDYQIKILQIDCKTNTESMIDLLPYIGSSGKIDAAFISYKQTRPILFVIYKSPNSSGSGMPYSSDWYMVFDYNQNKQDIFIPSKNENNFWGSGADIFDVRGGSSNLVNIYVFPYKSKENIEKGLASNLYKEWKNKKPIFGKVLRKTKLQEVPNYLIEEKRYLIKDNQFSVKAIDGGWLLVEYKNPKKTISTGWIMCQDTNICQDDYYISAFYSQFKNTKEKGNNWMICNHSNKCSIDSDLGVIQGPFKTNLFNKGEIYFEQIDDNDESIRFKLSYMNFNEKVVAVVDTYKKNIEDRPPEIESVFFYPAKGEQHIFVIVSWKGGGVYGDFYQVYAYKMNSKNILEINNELYDDYNLFGVEQIGSDHKFSYKIASEVKKYVDKKYNMK